MSCVVKERVKMDNDKLDKWSVLLLRPDYAACEFGQDTILMHVEAGCAEEAIATAQCNATSIDREEPENSDDYYPLLTVRGHIIDETPR